MVGKSRSAKKHNNNQIILETQKKSRNLVIAEVFEDTKSVFGKTSKIMDCFSISELPHRARARGAIPYCNISTAILVVMIILCLIFGKILNVINYVTIDAGN